MSFITWIMDPAHLAIILGCLLAISECLGLNSKIAANSVYQLVVGFIKKAKEAVTPKV